MIEQNKNFIDWLFIFKQEVCASGSLRVFNRLRFNRLTDLTVYRFNRLPI